MIYQTHPKHGQHIAYNGLEEKSNLDHGWSTVSEDEFYNRTPAIEGESVEIDALPERDELILVYIERFGKKPPYNMKTETMRAKVGE